MQQLITLLHIFAAIAVIALVLVQRGKGSDMGASFGAGASGTMFGSQGSTPFLVKITGILAMVFFVTSATLSFMVNEHANVIVSSPIPNSQPSAPIQPIPTTPVSSAPSAPAATGGAISGMKQDAAVPPTSPSGAQ